MISKQVVWRECTDEEKSDRILRGARSYERKSGWKPPTYVGTKMLSGDNKSRPGRNIRINNEADTFVYSTD